MFPRKHHCSFLLARNSAPRWSYTSMHMTQVVGNAPRQLQDLSVKRRTIMTTYLWGKNWTWLLAQHLLHVFIGLIHHCIQNKLVFFLVMSLSGVVTSGKFLSQVCNQVQSPAHPLLSVLVSHVCPASSLGRIMPKVGDFIGFVFDSQ